ncbi:hypothetical protein EON65_40670, partial [archaeon]
MHYVLLIIHHTIYHIPYRSQELISHLTEERTRLLGEVARLESQNLGLASQLQQAHVGSGGGSG